MFCLSGPLCAYGQEESLNFASAGIEAAVRETIGKPTGNIKLSDVADITALSARQRSIESLSGIEQLTALRELDLTGNDISDLSPLARFTSLTTLRLNVNELSDISPLAHLTDLRHLQIGHNRIEDISSLRHLVNLDTLHIVANRVADLSPLADLRGLKVLRASSNSIQDIAPLAGTHGLEELSLSECQIRDIEPLAHLAHLQDLTLADNAIDELPPMKGMVSLVWLNLNNNQIVDASPLSDLGQLKVLGLWGNRIADLSAFSPLENLERLTLSNNQIRDLSPLAILIGLRELSLGGNQIEDISVLGHLPGLSGHLNLSNNQIRDVSALVENQGIGLVDLIDLQGNPLSPEAIQVQIPTLYRFGVGRIYHDAQGEGDFPESPILTVLPPFPLAEGNYWIMDYVLREKRDVGAIRIEVHEPVSIPPLSEPIFNLGDGWQPALGAEGEIYFKISFSGYTGLVPYAADTLFVRSDSSGNMGYIGHLKQGKGVISIEEKEWIRVSESCRMEWTGEDYGTGKDRWRSYCEGEFYFGTEEMAFAPLAKDFWPQLMPYSPTNPHRLVALNISTPTWVFLTGFGPIWFSLSTDMQERIGQRLELSEAFVGGRMYTAWAAGTGIKLEGWGEIKRRFHHPKNSF